MSDTSLTTKDILQKQFKYSFRGYNSVEVDEYLDLIIRDYDAFQREISFLQSENERLMAKVDELSKQATVSKTTRTTNMSSTGVTNFDILKRLSNLEKHVFDAKLAEEETTTTATPASTTMPTVNVDAEDDDFYKTRVIKPIPRDYV